MIKLLNASLTRLCKNKAFWVGIIFSVGLALFCIYSHYVNMAKYGEIIELGNTVLNYPTIIGIVIAIFTSLFLGVEYSDGAIRNKITIGHKRINIYVSNLIIITGVSLFFYAIFLIITFSLGIPLFGMGTIPISLLINKILLMCAVIISYSSICTFIAMIFSNKTITSVVNIMFIFLLLMIGIYCYSMLNIPPTIQMATMSDSETKIEEVPNPRYLSEEQKKVYQTLLNINPAGQAFQIGEKNEGLEILPVYSLGILVVFTTIGLVVFEQKELK